MNYVDVGDEAADSAIVLVHGLGGRWQHWQPVLGELALQRRVIAVDLPGFGESALPPIVNFTLPDIADAVAALVRALGIGSIVFVGHSFGGPLAAIFAHRHPELVERLVLVCGTVQSFQQTLARRARPWVSRPLTAVATLAELLYTAIALPAPIAGLFSRSAYLRALALWPFVLDAKGLSPEHARVLIDSAGAGGVLPTARAIGRATGWERLPVQVPVALINGDHDLIAPLADLRAYPGRVDRAFVVKNTGHLPMIERPDAFMHALNDALSGY